MSGIATPKNWPWGTLKPLHYGVIHADPAWTFDTWTPAGVEGRAHDYRLQTLAGVKALPVKDLTRPDCVLALWSTNENLAQAFEVIDAWGFSYATVGFVWVKTYDVAGKQIHLTDRCIEALTGGDLLGLTRGLTPITKGYHTRPCVELCLFATLGAPKRQDAGVRQLILAPQREASRKPDEAAERLRQLYPGPYAELNARTRRPGWDAWGNELDKFPSEEEDANA